MRGPATEWLVLRARAGDREALDELLASAQDPLFRYLTSLLGERTLAEDVLQDVLFRIYRKLTWLREPSAFAPWAYRIASRTAFRRLARLRRMPEEPLVEVASVEETFLDRESIRRGIDNLSPASRAVIVLHYLEEMPLAEVAAVLEIPTGTAKSRLAYGLRRLREALR